MEPSHGCRTRTAGNPAVRVRRSDAGLTDGCSMATAARGHAYSLRASCFGLADCRCSLPGAGNDLVLHAGGHA